jgi:hypothetical protein
VTLRTVVGSSDTETLRRRVTETLGSEVVRLWTDTPSRRDSVLTPTLPPVRVLVPTLTPVLDPELMPVLLLDPVEVDPEVEFWA